MCFLNIKADAAKLRSSEKRLIEGWKLARQNLSPAVWSTNNAIRYHRGAYVDSRSGVPDDSRKMSYGIYVYLDKPTTWPVHQRLVKVVFHRSDVIGARFAGKNDSGIGVACVRAVQVMEAYNT